jgi:hypothetical protein
MDDFIFSLQTIHDFSLKIFFYLRSRAAIVVRLFWRLAISLYPGANFRIVGTNFLEDGAVIKWVAKTILKKTSLLAG